MNRPAIVLLALGLLQMGGDLLRVPVLQGIGAATVASPAPKVFSSVQGLETFSSEFYVEWTDRAGFAHSLMLTPEVYAHIKGPYNRRNIFGATLAYAPILQKDPRTREMFESVVRYALCGKAPLIREIGIDPDQLSAPPGIRLVPRSGTALGDQPFLITPSCP
jgi:hypothetical protein